MSYSLVIRFAAKAELREAANWYDDQVSALGVEFVAAVQRVFDGIVADPLRYAEEYPGVRGAQVMDYPAYCVYFRVRSKKVVILSVFHSSRDPTIWQSRT